MTRTRQWSDLTDREKMAIIAATGVQVSLAAAAWWDLAHRPASQIRGPKAAWAFGIAVNFMGPIAYFAVGRQH